jgi:hypothetical protein
MDNSRILNKVLDGKFHGIRPVGRQTIEIRRQQQEEILIAAEYKRMEETSRG